MKKLHLDRGVCGKVWTNKLHPVHPLGVIFGKTYLQPEEPVEESGTKICILCNWRVVGERVRVVSKPDVKYRTGESHADFEDPNQERIPTEGDS